MTPLRRRMLEPLTRKAKAAAHTHSGCVFRFWLSFSASFASLATHLEPSLARVQWTPGGSRKGHQSRNKTHKELDLH